MKSNAKKFGKIFAEPNRNFGRFLTNSNSDTLWIGVYTYSMHYDYEHTVRIHYIKKYNYTILQLYYY